MSYNILTMETLVGNKLEVLKKLLASVRPHRALSCLRSHWSKIVRFYLPSGCPWPGRTPEGQHLPRRTSIRAPFFATIWKFILLSDLFERFYGYELHRWCNSWAIEFCNFRTRWLWSTFSSHYSLSSKQTHQLALLTIFSPEIFFGNIGNWTRSTWVWKQIC